MNLREITYSPCIIYCHGNGGNKIDIVEIFDFLLWEFNIFSFDFSGSGRSDGDYVTLGYFEKDDVKAVVEFLRKELNIQKIILYGRSMGAVSALRYAAEDPNLKAIVLDSPFASFTNLCKEILFNKFCIPYMFTNILIDIARDKILSKIKEFDINKFIPSNNAHKVMVPTFMIHGLQDSLVHFNNSREIYNNLNSNVYKKLLEIEGEHNDCRSKSDHQMVRDFIIQFAYDVSIINEYKRRMNTLNAQYAFAQQNGIRINKVIKTMKIKFDLMRKKKLNNFNLKEDTNNRDTQLYDKVNKKLRSKSIDLIEEEDIFRRTSSSAKEMMTKVVLKRDNSSNIQDLRKHRSVYDFENEKKKEKDYIDLDETIRCPNFTSMIPVDHGERIVLQDIQTTTDYTSIHTVSQDNIGNIPYVRTISNSVVNDNQSVSNVSVLSTNCDVKDNSSQMNTECRSEISQNMKETENVTADVKKIFTPTSFPKIKPRLRSERNNFVGGILGCELRITSDKIKIDKIDRTNLKRNTTKD